MTCGNHIYHGKKFNARKETVEGEKYLGMPVFRFYIRCPMCLSEISFKVKFLITVCTCTCTYIKYLFRFIIFSPFLSLSPRLLQTDPENTDYAAEAGAYRTFQAENIAIKEIERKQQEKEEEEANNPMLVCQVKPLELKFT